MREIFLTQLLIQLLIVTLAVLIVWPSVISLSSQSVTKTNQEIWGDGGGIHFNLREGQQVSGSLTYHNGSPNGVAFRIYGPNDNSLDVKSTQIEEYNDTIDFSFKANTNGEYFANIFHDKVWSFYIDYNYTISPAPNQVFFIGLVIGISVVLTLINIFLNRILALKGKVWGKGSNSNYALSKALQSKPMPLISMAS